MTPINLARLTLASGFLGLTLLLSGCVTLGKGVTAREFDRGLESLTPGMTQATVLATLGKPREKRAAPAGADHDSVWIYSRFEVVGTKTVINEGAIGAGAVGIPTYEEEDITAIVQFRLEWDGDILVRWERFEPKSR